MKTVCSLNNINKRFGHRLILDDLSYSFAGGNSYAILGESGSGKTTLLNIIGLLDNKFDGEIYLGEKKVNRNRDNHSLRNEKIGFVFQSYYLIDYLNVRENILMPLEYSSKRFDEEYYHSLLAILGIENLEQEKVNYLSGEEKQRVAMARALINYPELIICDEPTGNLDKKNALQVIDLLKKIITIDKALIIVTHDEEVGKLCDHELLLEGGKLHENR